MPISVKIWIPLASKRRYFGSAVVRFILLVAYIRIDFLFRSLSRICEVISDDNRFLFLFVIMQVTHKSKMAVLILIFSFCCNDLCRSCLFCFSARWKLFRINSLTHVRSECDSKNGIFNLILLIDAFRSSYDDALRWMPQDLTDDKSTLVQVMAWCRQVSSHYLSQCWLSPLSPLASLGHNELKKAP